MSNAPWRIRSAHFLLALCLALLGCAFFAQTTFAQNTPDPAAESTRRLQTPNLSVPIPDLTFTPVLVENGVLRSNMLGEYIGGMYKYLISIAVIISIVFVMIGGLQYVLAAGTGDVSKAKKRITNAIVGLVLLMSAYVILYTVNPNLTVFRTLEVASVPRIVLDETIAEALANCPDVRDTVKPCTATSLTSGLDPTLMTLINSAAATYGVDPILIATHIKKETNGDIHYGGAIGPCGEIGPSQFMPSTFEAITGQTDCCLAVAAKNKVSDAKKSACEGNVIGEWPPPASEIPHCNISAGCGSCQVASASCIEYFNTSEPNGLRNAVFATAQLIRYNLRKTTGDIAEAMCAYNGSGKSAAAYAKDAARIYASLCTASGGTQEE